MHSGHTMPKSLNAHTDMRSESYVEKAVHKLENMSLIHSQSQSDTTVGDFCNRVRITAILIRPISRGDKFQTKFLFGKRNCRR